MPNYYACLLINYGGELEVIISPNPELLGHLERPDERPFGTLIQVTGDGLGSALCNLADAFARFFPNKPAGELTLCVTGVFYKTDVPVEGRDGLPNIFTTANFDGPPDFLEFWFTGEAGTVQIDFRAECGEGHIRFVS